MRHRIHASIRSSLLVLCFAFAAYAEADSRTGVPEATTAPVIVIGFVGGFVRHGDTIHSAVQVGRIFTGGNIHQECMWRCWKIAGGGGSARAKILRLLDTDHDGKLSIEEKRNARIILYGHSWGAAAVVALARELDKEGIPVLLTVQVDSVSKPGGNDRIIPRQRG